MTAIAQNDEPRADHVDDFSHQSWDLVPKSLRLGLKLYIEHGYQPGHFWTAVLENNLRQAVARVDCHNQDKLPDLIVFLHNYTPSKCWGSPEKVRIWMASGGLGKTFNPADY